MANLEIQHLFLRFLITINNRGIHANVIVYIFSHLNTTLRAEEDLFGIYYLQAAKGLVVKGLALWV